MNSHPFKPRFAHQLKVHPPRFDLTEAGITGAGRTAALIAEAEGGATISKRHLAQALARQYHREARVLMPSELGPYAVRAREAP